MSVLPYRFDTAPLVAFVQEWFTFNAAFLPTIRWSLDDLRWHAGPWFQQAEGPHLRKVVSIIGKLGNNELLHIWCRETDKEDYWEPIRLTIRPMRKSLQYIEYPLQGRIIEVPAI